MEISISVDPAMPNDLASFLNDLNKANKIAIHLDVFDGNFVPRKSMNVKEYHSVIVDSHHPIDAHLMVYNPVECLNDYISAKLRSLSFHAEAVSASAAIKLIKQIKSKGLEAGIVIDTPTQINSLNRSLIAACDCVTVMTVKAGASGQKFMPENLKKIPEIKKINPQVRIIIDGGLNFETIPLIKNYAIDTVVIGTIVYKATDRVKMLEDLYKALV